MGAKSIWLARDSDGYFAYRAKPKVGNAVPCETCNHPSKAFAGELETNCWELCDEVCTALQLPKLQIGEAVELIVGKIQKYEL